jgi:hypothetical protein
MIDCGPVYILDGGEADTVGSGSIVYDAEDIGSTLLYISIVKNFTVELELITKEIGLVPFVLDMVGVVPSVV